MMVPGKLAWQEEEAGGQADCPPTRAADLLDNHANNRERAGWPLLAHLNGDLVTQFFRIAFHDPNMAGGSLGDVDQDFFFVQRLAYGVCHGNSFEKGYVAEERLSRG
ncbi:hypothetical protein BI347_12990 [Chromobacterium sphagni]|uniref:Uncharacterized protein n=1 Tax=Chromobacterium sphagni TaxID=1903179 RepID=A0A1S1X491_9NEIS|nr:hypothetical protein BI347_12990 [Chromobacterium sphagni]